MLFSFAHCCNPAPLDPIIGYVSRGRGIIIHRKDCKNILAEPDIEKREINVSWSNLNNNIYSFFLRVKTGEDILNKLNNIIKRFTGKLIEFELENANDTKKKLDGHFSLELPNNKNVDLLLKEFRKIPSILFIDNR
jgi:GTP pyrophosphokinase